MKKNAISLPLILALCAALLLSGCAAAESPSASIPMEMELDGITEAKDSQTDDSSQTEGSQPANSHSLPEVSATAGDVVEIKEKLFIAQTNDIYINGDDYLGKTVIYEGLYKSSGRWDDSNSEIIHYVIRYGPGCCGYDGEAGFEIRWGGEYPKEDEWCEVVGTIRAETFDSGYKILYVAVTSLTVLDERGAETVTT